MGSSLLLGCDAEDLVRMRLAVSPLRNLVDAVHDGPRVDGGVARERWWASVRRNIPHRSLPVLELINAHPRFVPLPLIPYEPGMGEGLDAELDALEASEPERVAEEIELYLFRAGVTRPPVALLRLRDGGRAELRELSAALRALFEACIGDGWPAMRAALRRDLAGVTERAASLGLASAAGSVHPGVEWEKDQGALRIPLPGRQFAGGRIELGGRGLVLMPSLFGLDQTLPVLDGNRPPTLVYPARPGLLPQQRSDGLAALIGQGRARTLRAIGGGCTTGELASRLGVSAPTVSEHTTALRNADLIASIREGQRVRHVLTDLGDALVSANPGPS